LRHTWGNDFYRPGRRCNLCAIGARHHLGLIPHRVLHGDFVDSLAVFAVPEGIGLKSHIRLSGVLIKSSSITSSDVSTHFRPVLKNRLRGLTFAEAPLSAISRFSWSPESPETRRLFKAPREDDSSFRADLEQSTPNKNPFMKFVSLRTQRIHRRGKLDKPSPAAPESLTKPSAVTHQIHTYTELLQQIHDDLRLQHPEWVQPNGESPMCDSYESRLMELLGTLTRAGSNESIAAPHHALEHGLNGLDTAAAV